ncbi:MAG: DUF4465 domain-containing protein [Muribaculaceae bacterium]|nr:DUF4465 domain-containing protein [Muribaculaceae bacterium]MDE6130099.1 DUF4465 domain-containing protein [Muribaculaceae bacterium]
MNRAIIITTLLGSAFCAYASDEIITLDLTKAETELEFDSATGAWTGTFDDDAVTIDSQTFCILHNSMSDWDTWWGFTASNSSDNSFRDNFITYQYSAMPKGGIVLNEDGTVKTNEFGAPVVSADVPYLVAFANSMFAYHPAEIFMSDGLDHEAVGVYLSLNSYTYYSVADGDSFSRAFTNGDAYTVTIHGVNNKDEESSMEVKLASFDNGDLTTTRGWKYVDLSPLGHVNTIWFSVKSTDSGAYGDNTPSYFCLDKLMVKPASDDNTSGVANVSPASKTTIAYDRQSNTVTLGNADFAMVYDAAGNCVMSAHDSSFSLSSLSHGIYVVKAGDSSRKVIR